MRRRCADLTGSVPLGQISNHTAAKDLITIQQALLRATPGRTGCLVGLLGPILPVRARMAGDLAAHHRGATSSNQVSDTRLGQAHIHPRHDRRAIPGSKHPTTPHDQPPNSITTTRKLLTPYDTASCRTTTPPLHILKPQPAIAGRRLNVIVSRETLFRLRVVTVDDTSINTRNTPHTLTAAVPVAPAHRDSAA